MSANFKTVWWFFTSVGKLIIAVAFHLGLKSILCTVTTQQFEKSEFKSWLFSYYSAVCKIRVSKVDYFQSMTCYLFWVAALATLQLKIPPQLQPRATCFFDGRNSQAQPQLYQILVLIYILSSIKSVKIEFFGSKFALNC